MRYFFKSSLILFFSVLFLSFTHFSYAAESIKIDLDPVVCSGGGCPTGLESAYQSKGETCAATLDEFKLNPSTSHYWIQDPDITTQGRANERARQFISWVLSNNSIDNHPVLKNIWNTTRNFSYFLVVILAAILGIGFIIGQRTNFDLKIKIWPSIGKIAGALLFITFSAAIVLFLIQMSELLTKFFIENLGGKDLFNIYFSSTPMSQESNYNFLGCRDLNFGVQEAAKTQTFMMQATNITYYAMGIAVILRKIILWFMLFVSPFLAILFPFVFIRNVGWIWVGVFLQWLFYGPLFALFLGSLSKIWKEGIPFIFDFSRAGQLTGYVYPTATNILYGGPSQKLSPTNPLNNGSYVDTFAEYVITLIMLWAALLLPWLLLRIFRNYCCDGIYAMKNILLSIYDQKRNGPSPSPSVPNPSLSSIGTTLKMNQETQMPMRIKLETVEEIKRTKTEEIVKSLHLSANKITDIARLETNHQTQQAMKQNFEYLANPTKAQTPTERQKYMNLRTELFSRAIKEDVIAKQILSATTTSTVDKIQNREKILGTAPQLTPITQVISYRLKLPAEKISAITSSLTDSLSSAGTVISAVAQQANIPVQQVQTILSSYKQQMHQPSTQIVNAIAKETGLNKEQVTNTIKQVAQVLKTNKDIVKDVAQKQQVSEETVEKIIQNQTSLVAEPESHIEQSISIPSTVSIEDYEEVKKMWISQYEKGEVPITENITSRDQWIEQDIVFMTNTLNKLVASDDKLKQEGFDDVGFILPIFMINNLKGEELLVYLKAKLEAAKSVKEQTEKEHEITEKLKSKSEEVLVDAPAKTEENAKTMTMSEELPIDEKKKEEN